VVRLHAGEGDEKARVKLCVRERGWKVVPWVFDRGAVKGAMGFAGGSTLAIGIWKPIGVGGGLSMSGASLARGA
jgi:hypothetical protein